MSLDLFLVLMIPFLVYGALIPAYRNSKTTYLVIVFVFGVSFFEKLQIPINSAIPEPSFLLYIYLFLLFLFIRAVFRPVLLDSTNVWIRKMFHV